MNLQEVPGQQGYIYSNKIATQLQCNGTTTTLKCALLIWTAGKHCYKNEQWTSTGTQTQPISRLTAGLVDTHTWKLLQQSMYTKNVHYGVPHPTDLLQKKYMLSSIRMISLNALSLHYFLSVIIHFLFLHSYVMTSSSYYKIYKQGYLYVALFLSSFKEIRLNGYAIHMINGPVDTSL